jgi:hypothetical protein
MYKWILPVLLFVLLASTVDAAEKTLVFTSGYTYLSRECKWAYAEKDLAEGQDNALICRGFGNYQIFIYFSAMDSYLSVRLKDSPDSSAFDQAIGGIDEKAGVVEWRMAGKVPFAIIVRSREYSSPEEGRKLLKETLIIRGLGQYSDISGLVNVKNNVNANEKARTLADDAFMKIKSSNRKN